MENDKKMRIERLKKLKRVINYDAEIAFLEKFWDLKKKTISINDFKSIVKSTLIDTKQISEIVGKHFIEELYVKEKIEKLKEELSLLDDKQNVILKKIDVLEESLINEDEEDDVETNGFLGGVSNDPCSTGRTGFNRRSSC